jgi:hypothetical protein
MGAVLSGAQEAPAAVVTEGRGSAHFTIQGDQLSFVITYSGLSGAATRAHIHGPAAIGVNAGVLIDLAAVPRRAVRSFRAVCGNGDPDSGSAGVGGFGTDLCERAHRGECAG